MGIYGRIMVMRYPTDQLRAIEAQEKKIADQIATLQKEADDLATAKRVLKRLSGVAEAKPSAADDGLPDGKLGPERPKGVPTNLQMVEFVLGHAEREGKDGLTANEIVEAIRARYWPGLVGEQILPSIYGFGKKGRLRKTASGKFKRIKGPAGTTAEPSE